MTNKAQSTAKIIIKHRFTDAVLYEFKPTEEQQTSGLAMRAALEVAVLRGAVLIDADLSGAVLWLGDDVPVLPNIHQQVYEAASTPNALDMGSWHGYCGTTHCRAGWVVTLAGEEGKKLEGRMGTAGAAMAIYLKSDPERWAKDSDERLPDFYCGNEKALADMERLADEEAAKAAL